MNPAILGLENITTTPLSWAGTIPAKGLLVLGGAGVGVTSTVEDTDPGSLTIHNNRTLANVVIASLEDFGGGQLRVGASLSDCLTAGRHRTINGRLPDYYAGELDQLVIYNPEATGIEVSISAEQRMRSGSISGQGVGAHPGHGVLTLPLGSIDPDALDAGDIPIVVRVAWGRAVTLTSVKAFSAVPIVVTGGAALLDVLDSADATVLDSAVDLEALVAATLTAATLVDVDGVAVARDGFVDVSIDIDAFAGTAGDVTVELGVSIP